MPIQDAIVVPEDAPITIALEPAYSAIHSLLLLSKFKTLSGLGDWVASTIGMLTPEERDRHELVLIGFHYAAIPEQSWPSFPAYLDHLAGLDPVALRDKMLAAYARFPLLAETDEHECAIPTEPLPLDLEAILKDADSYLDFLRTRFKAQSIDEALERQAYSYVIDPPAMQKLIVSHMQDMWDKYLSSEWARVEPMLQRAVEAFRQTDFSDMDRREVVQLVTGQEIDEEKWQKTLGSAEQIIFMPSAHIGPYLTKFWSGSTLRVLFGARLPEGAQAEASDLSRAEIVVLLSALADDSRLQILRLVLERREMSSQEIIASLDLSQSTVSRHLKQLSATGYLSERRCGGGKCYSLNTERIEDTLRSVSLFLLGK